MTAFDADRFEHKYEEYFTELQEAYHEAFETMNARHDSQLIHAIDQRILCESEPVYEDGAFRVELPDDARDRIPDDRVGELLDEYVTELRAELRRVFDLD